jgi:hypothetical protein
MLNPGDMFSVDLEKVLFATGAPKGLPRSSDPKWQRKRKGASKEEGEAAAEVEGGEAAAETEKPETKSKAQSSAKSPGVTKAAEEKEPAQQGKETKEYNKSKELSSGHNWWDDPNRDKIFDPLKPYRTPWRPRYYLSAFAFIPKYLEVNHNIGHAVYLRDPVARPGQSEVCLNRRRREGKERRSVGLMWFCRCQHRSTRRLCSWRTPGSCDGDRAEALAGWVVLYFYTMHMDKRSGRAGKSCNEECLECIAGATELAAEPSAP